MARQEISSTFSDGLMMDLNPINTPKSVLTDCLNGTYITYNGNEFVLQNDMGNYKLKNCKLPTNFIPVGVKGYGDILYIVSYNPITNETEIGSYPAPQSIFTTGDSEAKIADTDDLAPFTWGEGSSSKEVEYPTIIKNNKKPIFIFTDSNEETYKLNPGDEFKFSGELTPLDFIYQHLNFYIIDEDNKLYDIDDTQIYNENNKLVSQEMRKVFWETPGWLAAQYDLYVPDKFNLNLRSLNVPEFLVAQSDGGTSSQAEEEKPLDEQIPSNTQFKVSMDLSSQTIITDKLFQTELDKNFGHSSDQDLIDTYDHLYIRYLIKQNQNPPKEGEDDYGTFKGIVVSIDDTHTKDYTNGVTEGDYVYYDIPVWKHNYQDDIITAYNNIKPIWFCNNPETLPNSEDLDIANYHGVVELTAYPIIKYGDLTLKYTQFSTTQRFPLNTLKNSSDITIADSIYKWSVDDDSCTISFNINGPFINASDITGRYEIYRINLFNHANSAQNAKSQAAEGTNENPKSISSYNVEEGLTGDFLIEENGKWIRNSDQNVDENSFTSSEKLLMCEGNLSNLVLYGQNTLNIDWSSSKEYELKNYYNYYTNPDYDFTEGADNGDLEKAIEDTSYIDYESKTKTIDFSKEGGIYIFRVILEQNGSQLAESRQVLIPSEVFNEWFGSIDNYNNIYENQWIEKYKEYIICSNISILNLSTKFNNNKKFITYNNINVSNNTDFLTLFKTYNDTEFSNISKKPISQKDILKINYSKEIEIENIDVISNFNYLNGNLWNPKLTNNLSLLQNSTSVLNLLTSDFKTFDISSFQDTEYLINYIGNSYLVQEYSLNQLYPNRYKYLGIHTWGLGSNIGRRGKIWGQFWRSEYGQPNTTINIGGGTGEVKDWTYDTTGSLFQDPNELWNQSECRFGGFSPISCWNHETQTYCRLAWGDANGGIDDSRVVYDGRGTNLQYPDRCLVFPAANQYKNDSKDGAVVVVFGSTSDKTKAIGILQDLYVKQYKDSSSTIYSSKISTQLELNSSINLSINKINVESIISLLRIDDEIILFNTVIDDLNINSDSNLCKTINTLWENVKQFYNISASYNLLINLLSNPTYSNLYSSFNSKVETYNNTTDSQIREATEVSNENDRVIYNGTLSETDPMVNTIKKKIVGLHKNTLTIENSCWDNQTWSTIVGYKKDNGGDIVNTTGRIIFTYIEDYQNQ